MPSKMCLAARKVCLALVSVLCVDLAMGAGADADRQPVAEPDELEAIWVHGKSLVQRIEEAEDEFFEIYNKLNKTNRYDVQCGVTALSRDSMIMVRKCAPEYRLSYATYYLPDQNYGRYVGTSIGGDCWGSSYNDCTRWPGREVTVLQGTIGNQAEYARNVLNVIQSDQGLQARAADLGKLYTELELTQQRYVELNPPRKSATPRLHPRSR